jgi:hypothetical protein
MIMVYCNKYIVVLIYPPNLTLNTIKLGVSLESVGRFDLAVIDFSRVLELESS